MCAGTFPRERIVWSPEWDRDLEYWSSKFIKQNIWRCDRLLEFKDLLQEAYLTFVYVANAYPRVIEGKHFMALFKRASINKMHDRASRRGRIHANEVPLTSEVSEFFIGRMGEVTNSGYLAALLREVPEELQLAMKAMLNGDKPVKAEYANQIRDLLTA